MSLNPLFRADYLLFAGILFVSSAAGLAWLAARRSPRPLRFGLAALRAAAASLLVLVALNPGRWVSPPVDGRPFAAVLLDRSASMDVPDVEGASRWAAARDAVLSARSRLPDPSLVRLFSFDSSLREIDPPSLPAIAPDGPATDIFGAGQALLNRFASDASRLSGVLFLSDGRQTAPSGRADLAIRARAAGIPVSAVPLGGPVPRRDLEIRSVRRLAIAFGDQSVRIPVRVRGAGLGNLRVDLSLAGESGAVLQSLPLDLPDGADRLVSLDLPASPPGFARYTLSVPAMDGESSLANNRDEAAVATLDSPLRVLMLEGSPHWDSKFLAQLVRRQPGMEITSFYRLGPERFLRIDARSDDAQPVSDQPFPSSFAELAAYDLVVVGKGIEYFLSPERSSLLQRYLSEAGGCLLFSRGKPYDGSLADLSPLEPVVWGPPLGASVGMLPTAAGEDEGLFGSLLPARDDPVWSSLPNAFCSHRVAAVHGMGRVLLESAPGRDASGVSGLPLVVARRVGLGLSLVVNADGLWHWGFFPGDESIADLYAQFWIQFFYWAATHRDFLPGQDFSLRVEPQSAAPGVPVRAILRSRSPVADSGALPRVSVSLNGVGVDSASPSADSDRRWEIPLDLPDPGVYSVELLHPSSGAPLGPRAVAERLAAPGERDNLSADPAALADLAAAAGGGTFSLGSIDAALASVLPGDDLFAASVQPQWRSAWDRGWLLALAFALFGAEWFLRRRNGLA